MTNVLALPVEYVPSHATTSLFSSFRQRRPPSDDDWAHNEFDFEPFVKNDLQIKLETDDRHARVSSVDVVRATWAVRARCATA